MRRQVPGGQAAGPTRGPRTATGKLAAVPAGTPGAAAPGRRLAQPAASPPPAGVASRSRASEAGQRLATAPGAITLNVYSKAVNDTIGIETLVGEFAESGSNHGRKVFKRVRVPAGVEDIPVFVYFWDDRDGADFHGWWFGESVGGSQVWSKCNSSDALPPQAGWRIPWDGDVQEDLVVERRARALETKLEKQEEPADTTPGTEAEAVERVQRAEDRVQIAEAEAEQALESTRVMLEGDVTQEHLEAVDELLQAQLKILNEANKTLAADIMDARKTAPKAVKRLMNLAPRVRSVQSSLGQEIKATRELSVKKQQEAEDAKKRAIVEEQLMQQEQLDAKALEEALPEAMEAATKAEELMDTVLTAASPLESDAAEEGSSITVAAIRDTEAAVVKALLGLKEARTHINTKVAAAKLFAPDARRVALAEYGALQDKLNDLQKKMQPYTRIRKEFQQRRAARKVMEEVTRRIGEAEHEVDKVIGLLGKDPSDDDLRVAESSVAPAMTTLAAAIAFVDEKAKGASAVIKPDLEQVLRRGAATRKKLAAFQQELRGRMDAAQLRLILRDAAEKTKAAEEALAAAEEVEARFAHGADLLLPFDETSSALASSIATARAAEERIAEAKDFLKAKIVVVGCYPEAAQGSAVEAMSAFMARVEDAAERLAVFKKATSERETASMLHDVTQKVVDAEAKVQRTIEAAEPLLADQAEVELERVKVATELTLEAEKAAALACADSRKMLTAKLQDCQGEAAAACAAELAKLQARLAVAVQELARQRKVALQGERLWKARLAIREQSEDFRLVEDEVEQAEILTTPLGDERPSEEKIREMVDAVDAVQAKVSAAMSVLASAQSAVQGSAKAQLDGLLERVRVAQGKVDEMKETTQEQRERLTCEALLREARGRLEALEEALRCAADAEAPYLKGLEQLPLDVMEQAVAASELAIVSCQAASDEAEAMLKAKGLEVRALSEAVSKHGLKELELIEKGRLTAAERLALFVKETTERKRAMNQQQAASKVEKAEAAAQAMTDTAREFAFKENDQGQVELSLDAAREMCERFGSVSKQAEDCLDDARKFLFERQRATRSERKDQAAIQETAKLVSRLNVVQQELQKAKAMASEHEQRFVAKMVIQEASDSVQKLEDNLKRLTEEARPLLEEGGRTFVVASMLRMVAEGLSEHGLLQNLSLQDLFGLIDGAGSGQVSEEAMVNFLERVPTMCSRSDLAFSAVQRKAMFAQIDSNGDGMVSEAEFLALFRDQFVCVHPISVTDGYDISSSKTLDKLELDDIVEALAEPLTNETSGMTRIEVRRLQDGVTGWVTMQGNQGKLYLQLYTKYTAFSKALDALLQAAKQDSAQASEYINSKASELARCEKGPLAEAKAELSRLRPQASVLQAKLEQLRKRLDEARQQHNRREELERRKVEDKKDRKAAAVVLKAVRDKVEAAEAGLAALQAAAAPLAAEDISGVADPISVQEATEQAAADMERPIAAARSCLTAHEGKVAKATRGPWLEAKKDMQKLNRRITELAKQVSETMQAVKNGCSALAEVKIGQVSVALRQSIHSSGDSTEALFSRLSDSEDCISSAALFRHLEALPGLELSEQHKRLLSHGQDASGFSRHAFFDMVERYYRCVKEIAVTTSFDIKSGNTLRKLEVGELVEVLEGPQSDTALGVMRIRARALSDGRTGWVTATGNHGTPFLQEVARPCLCTTAELALQKDFSTDSAELRSLQAHEVLEVLEGPRKEEVCPTVRARCKALSDGVVGWLTCKNKHGVDFVAPGKKTYTCCSSIALTDGIDIKTCKVVRKLSKGERLTVLEGPVQDDQTSVPRIRVIAASDNAEGWVTVRGNAGSVYAEETGQQMVVCRAVPLQTAAASDTGETIRVLAEEETVEVLAGPEEEASVAPLRVRVRASRDRQVGWLTADDQRLQPCSSRYRCMAAAPLHDALTVEGSAVVRRLEPGEEVELLQGPRLEEALGVMRLRGRATKDGAVGWVTIAGNQGKAFLKCLPPE